MTATKACGEDVFAEADGPAVCADAVARRVGHFEGGGASADSTLGLLVAAMAVVVMVRSVEWRGVRPFL